uniref:Uncharacterized protein n=1 Tax=Arundo donax TaxID=35708 RepID=A0A0A8ZAX6_ARUDO
MFEVISALINGAPIYEDLPRKL